MDQSTIVFTHYALLLTAATFFAIGGSMGWAITNYLRKKDTDSLQSRLRELQMRMAGKQAAEQNKTSNQKQDQLGKKKDELIKDFMKRQVKQQGDLDKTTRALKAESRKSVMSEKRLNAASISLDQWKKKCSSLAANQAMLQRELIKLKTARNTATAPGVISKSFGEKSAVGKPHKATSTAQPLTDSGVAPAVAPVITPLAPQPGEAGSSSVVKAPAIDVQPPSASELDVQATGAGKAKARKAPVKSGKKAVSQVPLTHINGIGPAIAKALGEVGIHSIQDLAALKQKDVNRIDKELGKYAGRITRQNWVEQAKKLYNSSQKTAA